MNETDIFQTALAEKTAKIDNAIAILKQNQLADISGMDTEIDKLCQDILQSDDIIRGALEPAMLKMITKLDALETELKEFQRRKSQEKEDQWNS